jgi:hypothetical protein
MKKVKDPATLFKPLSRMENKFNTNTKHNEEGDIIAVVLDASPAKYQRLLTLEQRIKGTGVNLSNLEVVMSQQCWQKQHKKRAGPPMIQNNSFAVFAGKCFGCGELGHMRKDCPKNKNYNSSNHPKWFNGKCFNCGKEGHMEKDCWEKQENKDKRPEG